MFRFEWAQFAPVLKAENLVGQFSIWWTMSILLLGLKVIGKVYKSRRSKVAGGACDLSDGIRLCNMVWTPIRDFKIERFEKQNVVVVGSVYENVRLYPRTRIL